MSVAEMKKAIHEKVDKISSQQQLNIMLEVLNKLESKENSFDHIDVVFKKASDKYGTTLQKLAE